MRFWIGILISALTLIGCDPPDGNESAAVPPPVVAAGTGVIRGTVKFTGAAPEMKTVQVPCHNGPVAVADESVLVNANGTLRNVFVYLEGAPPADGTGAEPALLDQVDCRYVPHVLGVQAGQRLRVRSSDPTLHNVHALAQANRPFNLSMTRAGDEKAVTFARHEFVPVKCDVHPWMTAYVGVFDNPWFDVTRDSGSFEIKNVPEGSYKLVGWHERYGRTEQDVKVVNDQSLQVKLEYRAPEDK